MEVTLSIASMVFATRSFNTRMKYNHETLNMNGMRSFKTKNSAYTLSEYHKLKLPKKKIRKITTGIAKIEINTIILLT
jgi:hypothetical protein